MSLRDILGDTEIGRQLDKLIASHRLPHAVVLESADSSLGKSAAKELAKACVCTNEVIKPCGQCSNCLKVSENIHPDIYTVEITDKKQAVGVGEIRNVISDCFIKPNEASCKVYFIFDKMTAEAQNALLKILEEPPQNVQFIIVTESSSILLQTVRSRSAVFKLNRGAANDDNDTAANDLACEIAAAIPKNIELPLLLSTGKLAGDKALALKTLEKLEEILNTALEEKYLPSGNAPRYIDDIVRTLRKRSVVKLIDVISKARIMILQNCNMNLLVTWLCASIRRSRHTT